MADQLTTLTDEQLDALIAQRQAGAQEAPQDTPAPPAPSALTDAAKVTLPAVAKLGITLATAPQTIANLEAQGVNAAGDYFFPDWKASPPGKAASAVENFTAPGTASATQKKIENWTGQPFYSAQTVPGKMWESAVGAAPLGVIGEGAVLPNMVRALLSGAASEGAGQATAGTPYELPARLLAGAGTYGVTGAGQAPRIIANTPRAAAAQTLERAGVPVSAADISGGRLAATLEGQSPAGQSEAVSNAMKQQGGVVRPPGNTNQFSQILDQRQQQLGAQANQLGAQTAIPATPQVRQQLVNSVASHLTNYGGTSLEKPEVTQALKDYDALTANGTPLTGTQYQALTQQWNSSGVPELRTMANTLDNAMDAAHPGAWNQWRQNWADYTGLRAAADQLGGESTLKPLSPDKIVGTMHKQTPMRDTAEAAQTIIGARPQPYDFQTMTNLGHVISALGGAAGVAGGAYHGGLTGAEQGGLIGALVPEIVSRGPQSAMSLMAPAFRSAPGQRLLRNMDPKVAAALLANQGLRSKGAPAEEPQGAQQ